MTENAPAIIGILGIVVGLGLLTFFVVATTSFIKIAVVLFIVRNALGIQQTPPNIVIYGIALALTVFVMSPVLSEVSAAVMHDLDNLQSFDDWIAAFDRAKEPIRAFLIRFTPEPQREFFLAAAGRVWPEGTVSPFAADDLSVLIPGFLVVELERAFAIGFLLYLPLIVVDLVVTTVLMAMGMSMVTPTIISTPVKLFLFVTISGWTNLVQGLVLTYAT
ncbi:type III secretion system export apparatus subunit SctR [Roseobacter weihaiensis]|uniref:type III secretion system export apparatus subunit SctR n=1 Tax=Roseobacter weihaiensis TaxID=2763262 RepID=UPI001D0B551C|nr:type III secretion system export apparatus subunit SctR [Roseobacter sp. H9]